MNKCHENCVGKQACVQMIRNAEARAAEKHEAELQEYKLKAERWDAFMSQGRIRILGWAKLGEIGYQHMGFEIWTQYGKPGEYDFTKDNEEAKEHIETYIDAWIKTQEINKLEDK